MQLSIIAQNLNVLSFKNYPYAFEFFLNLFALVCRYYLMIDDFNFIGVSTLISIILQIIVLFFIIRIKKKIMKIFYLICIFSLFSHLLNVYFLPFKKYEFFAGMETIIIICANFKRIKNKILRSIILAFVLFGFLKRETDLDINISILIYLIYLLLILEFSILFDKKDADGKPSSHVKIPILSKFTINETKPDQVIPEKVILDDQNFIKEIMNRMNLGVLMMDQSLNLIYKNEFFFEKFMIDENSELKNIICSLEENIDLNESDFYKIEEFGLKKIFENTMRFTQPFDSSKFDQYSENFGSKKLLFEEIFNSSHTIARGNTIVHKIENRESIFKGWNKKMLKENLEKNIFGDYTKDQKKKNPITVYNYLNKILEYYTETNNDKESEVESSFSDNEVEKYSMYACFPSSEHEEEKVQKNSFHLNFYPLKNKEHTSKKNGFKILITMRELSELEKKYLKSLGSNNKMLGSFCHELRTPINGLINMLDLLQTQSEDLCHNHDMYEDFKELISNSVVNSHLLLNQIDDFIDYFAFCNEILELHISSINFQTFLNDINRVISSVTEKKNINFTIEIDGNIPAILFNDCQKLKRIIYNLINNSIRFTNSGGLIKVCAKLRKQNYIRISVIDTGSGIKTEELSFLGKLNNKEMNKNTCGFGLFMCNILCLMIENEGSANKKGLTVYSEHGIGTCFNFKFKSDMNSEFSNSIKDKGSKSSFSEEKKERNTIWLNASFNDFIHDKIVDKNFLSSIENDEIIIPNSVNSEDLISNTVIDSDHIPSKGNCNCQKQKKQNSKGEVSSLKDFSFSLSNDCKCPRVLIVDDVPFNIEACSRILMKLNIPSDSACNGLDAIEKITNLLKPTEVSADSDIIGIKNNQNIKFCNHCKFYKLILMDVDMPIKNGIEATEEILILLQNTDISVFIVGLSAFDQIDIANKGKEAGMCEFVTKPIQAQKIKELIFKYVFNKSIH